MKGWVECDSCGTEFRVVSDSDETIEYCPYCGGEINHDDEDEDDEDGYYEE